MAARTEDGLQNASAPPLSTARCETPNYLLHPQLDSPHDVRIRIESPWPEARTFVLNDLTSSGYCYAAQGYRDFCVITVGSRIGNKVFVGGRASTDEEARWATWCQ